jgi:ABC-type antimicrobial peptide transport system permease subunit
MNPSTWLSIQELTKRRFGTAVAAGVIGLAVAFSAGLELVARAREAAVAADMDQMGPAIRIIPRGKTSRDLARFELDSAPFDTDDIRRLRRECRSSASTIEGRLSLKVPFRNRMIPVVGVGKDVVAPFDDFQRLSEDELLVGAELASDLGLSEGDAFKLQGKTFKILAVLPQTASEDDTALFVHLPHLQKLFGLPDRFNEIRIFPAAGADVNALAASLTAAHTDVTTLTTQRGEEAEQSMHATLRDHRRVLYLVTGVVIAVSVLIWSYINGTERRLELATLVAVGGSAWTVVAMILTRGALLGVFGAILGYLAGMSISLGQDFESTLRVLPAFDLAGIILVTSTVLCAAGALPAAGLVAVQDPVKVLQDA